MIDNWIFDTTHVYNGGSFLCSFHSHFFLVHQVLDLNIVKAQFTHTHTIIHMQTHTHRIDGGFTYHWRITKVCNDYGLLSTEILEKDKEKNI